MTLSLYNTRTKQLEDFTPLSDDKVTLYTCGPTVYDHPHVGNWASYIYWDMLVRALISSGYHVERVMNITDVGHLVSDADDGEDKLEKGARREGKTAWEIAEFYAEDFLAGMEKLGLIPPEHITKATDFITQQLDLVRILKERGYTYQTTDGIYFDTAKFPTYADFAGLDLTAQRAGARVEANDEKHQPWDFALWKFTPAGQKRDMEWETPADLLDLPMDDKDVIMGFPGWHLECSAMAMSILGATIDIHTGGIDHIPVHHTNEIAQSEAASGQQFSRTWMHSNHLKIDGGKISKSLGNGYTLQDVEKKGFSPIDLRLSILQGHYQHEGNFTWDNLEAAHNRLAKWRNYAALRHQSHDGLHGDTEKKHDDHAQALRSLSTSIHEAIQHNLNTPDALRSIDEAFATLDSLPVGEIHRQSLVEACEAIDELLGLQLLVSTPDIDDESKQLLVERQRARDAKDWHQSDELRDKLAGKGIAVRDTTSGSIWSYL